MGAHRRALIKDRALILDGVLIPLSGKGSFQAGVTNRALSTKVREEIISLKTLCSHMKIAVETPLYSKKTGLFCYVTLCEQVKADKPQWISMFSDGAVHLDKTRALIEIGVLIH